MNKCSNPNCGCEKCDCGENCMCTSEHRCHNGCHCGDKQTQNECSCDNHRACDGDCTCSHEPSNKDDNK